jgi:molybdopterin molybdotransferase
MISVEQAQLLIEKKCHPLGREGIVLKHALGYVTAEDIYAPFDLPVANNSAMDGFVIRSRDSKSASMKKPISFKIRGVIKAGDCREMILKGCEAYRIMTGAFVPSGGDAVIIKERAEILNDELIVRVEIPLGQHVRFQGEEVRRGKLMIEKHTHIHPATVGILATLGRHQVSVFKRPSVSLIATGSELVRPGIKLKSGQIYDSNSYMIASALHRMGIQPIHTFRVGDQFRTARKTIEARLSCSDVVIIMGGVSVGDYDYVKDILQACGVETVFWRVSQKPGKPLYFGKKGPRLVFGLPGNPASVYTCFYQYVFPALKLLSGSRDPYLRTAKAVVRDEIKSDSKRLLFLKAKTVTKGKVTHVVLLKRQGSHMISSLQVADSFIRVPAGTRKIKKGDEVDIHMLPHSAG